MTRTDTTRRSFIRTSFLGAAGSGFKPGSAAMPGSSPRRQFEISLAAWSLHRAIKSRLINLSDFPRISREMFGITAVELVSTLFDTPGDAYVRRIEKNAADAGVRILLIMCDGEGFLGHPDQAARRTAVRNHFKWVDIAAGLGCHSIRVNMDAEENKNGGIPALVESFLARSIESFTALVEYAATRKISILVENHGGLSSDAGVVVRLMQGVGSPFLGTLPDFGNFPEHADIYREVRRMMPFAKAVSAKCYDFDAHGMETRIDYKRMLKIVVDEAGYHGHLGIEYEGTRLTEYEGILACKSLLERLRG